ncbi:MAG: hypothetical protein LBD90_03350, partial [Bifidobacteriaceae bacterium]|nr:hypothetical protein [Bifidobacteriaceae bacterium]
DDAPVDRARLTSLAERGPDVGVHILWLATRTEALPAACRTFVIASDAPDSAYHGVTPGSVGEIRATAGQVRFGLHTYPLVCEGVGAHDCEGLARRLAPVIDAGALVDDDSDLPRALSYLTLAGHELAESPAHVAERWQQTFSINNREPGVPRLRRKPGGLSALVGQSAAGQFNLDLRLEGPHALVGGTTGAGKSEFLQAWVMGLATKYSPDRVTFLFIDYKGGSAFADCVQLPHCVGLVTDLSPHLVRRALTSLRAEIAHREHLLNRKKAKDLVSLEREGDPDTPPSLLIIVDEFAALVQEVPEFVDGVIDVAQRGRSLGLHLILATQRPAGVIKDNLRANTNLRIALRMADADDSSDVLGDPMAAHFDQSIPGRAAAKTGPGRIAQFQTGYVGGWTDATPEPARVDIDQLDFGVAATWERAEDPAASARAAADPGPNDIGRMVTTIGEAFDGCGLPLPRKPWLEPLAPVYDLARLQGYRDDAHLLLGVMDDPKAQDQPVVHYEPDRDGNLAILGAGGSGKSTALRTIALSAALSTRHGGPTHVYGLDFSSGGLKMLEPLPHVGAIIQGDDEERVIRLLRTLKGVVDERVTRYAQANAATIGEYRAATGQADEPRILLLIDGMANFREEYEYSSRSAWFTTFAQIAADGRPLGVHIVMTGDRAAAIPASIAATVQRQIVLRLASEDDYVALSAPKDVLGAASPPGRGVIGSNELQFAVLGADSNVAVQARAIEAVAETARRRGGTRAAPILRLPDKVPLEALPIRDARAWPTIGLADLDLAPIGIEPVGSLMLAGPAQSGRTTALLTIAIAVERANSTNHAMDLALIAPRKSVLESALSWQVVANGEDEAQALADEMIARFASESRPGRYGVFIDSVGDFTGTAAEDPLDRMVRAAVRSQQLVVGESESSTWSEAWTIAKPFKAGRRGLVLGSGESDADGLLGVSVGRTRAVDFPPGRGFLITGGRFQKVQIATVT